MKTNLETYETAKEYLLKYNQYDGPFSQLRAESLLSSQAVTVPMQRRYFFKIMLILGGKILLRFGAEEVLIDKPAIFFINPFIPYAYKTLSVSQSGYFCVFTPDFLINDDRMGSIRHSHLFDINLSRYLFLSAEQVSLYEKLFQRIIKEENSFYAFKDDLIRDYLHVILHEAMKIDHHISHEPYLDANSRIANEFNHLLEGQFPITSPNKGIFLKKPKDFADHLFVHVNHLNFVLHAITGKPTSLLISERILQEAKELLSKTNWSVADIASSLGFDYPTYFNRFFKKNCGQSPIAFRRSFL
ncbi:transcriptional regulator, AraC family [bacterium A37T11]|nr:transcriptional regulator, AraC family [bacterium A37T11]